MPRHARRKRTYTRSRRQREGVSLRLVVGIGKTGFVLTKAIGEHQKESAKKISRKRRAEVASVKRKKYAGGSLYCSNMLGSL